jgi:hypothetical protein
LDSHIYTTHSILKVEIEMKSNSITGVKQAPWVSNYTQMLSCLISHLKIDARTANRVNGLARSRSWKSLVDEADKLSQQQYESADEHRRYNQLALFISKVPFSDPGLQPEETALAKFQASEYRMGRVNRKFEILRRRLDGRTPHVVPQGALFLDRCRKFIARVLGPLKLDEVYGECYMGDGSAVGCSGKETHIIAKMRTPTFSQLARPFVVGALHFNAGTRDFVQGGRFSPFVQKQVSRTDLWLEEWAMEVDHNLVDFVPKNAKTHRAIAMEPSLNCFVQLGAGRVIAKRLRRFGIDLTSQEKNQAYARFGSKFWEDVFSVATIDLSAASDSISIELVRLLLPPDWWRLLNSLRSTHYRFEKDGPSIAYNKFASMGNGFCFPLQTLIYLAIVRSVLQETRDTLHTVYGDDIIVPKGAALLVIERLRYCGFRVNVDKTFVHGPFRESCGADFFGGNDVRPFVLDYLPEFPTDIIKIANGIGTKLGVDTPFTGQCLAMLKPSRRFVKPWETGAHDDAILVPKDTFMASEFAKWRPDLQTWNFKVMSAESAFDERPLTECEQMLALLHGSTPARVRAEAKRESCEGPLVLAREGQPALPRRFTARYKGKWYIPAYKRAKPPHLNWWESVPEMPALDGAGNLGVP